MYAYAGKLCDRAVHLQILPMGSVHFEITLAEGIFGTVIAGSCVRAFACVCVCACMYWWIRADFIITVATAGMHVCTYACMYLSMKV